jgi:hypothetical protein
LIVEKPKVFHMICNGRTTRILPGLSRALSWLRQNLPPTERPFEPIPLAIPLRPQRRRPSAPQGGASRRPERYR